MSTTTPDGGGRSRSAVAAANFIMRRAAAFFAAMGRAIVPAAGTFLSSPTVARNQDTLTIRPWRDDDLADVLGLLDAAMGWVPDEVHESFFRWKHLENPFGRSPAWVMTDDERIVGFRIFMRWEFEWHGAARTAVRAVDTATHPDYQGRGIFS